MTVTLVCGNHPRAFRTLPADGLPEERERLAPKRAGDLSARAEPRAGSRRPAAEQRAPDARAARNVARKRARPRSDVRLVVATA
jgi:hypothetical protein